jgi:hypothetical protein
MQVILRIALCFVFSATLIESYPQSPSKHGEAADFEKRCDASLQRFKEVDLCQVAKNSEAETYRLMIFPTWGNAISIRVQKNAGIYAVSARRLDGQAGFQIGNLVEQKDSDLTPTDSKELDDLIAKVNLFEMPSDDEFKGFDGDTWTMEGVSRGNYHFVERWCATKYNPKKRGLENFDALCKFLVDKSKLSVRPTNKGHALI